MRDFRGHRIQARPSPASPPESSSLHRTASRSSMQCKMGDKRRRAGSRESRVESRYTSCHGRRNAFRRSPRMVCWRPPRVSNRARLVSPRPSRPHAWRGQSDFSLFGVEVPFPSNAPGRGAEDGDDEVTMVLRRICGRPLSGWLVPVGLPK